MSELGEELLRERKQAVARPSRPQEITAGILLFLAALTTALLLTLAPKTLPHTAASAWTAQTSGTASTLYGLSCPATSTCFTDGASGTILETTTGGSSWTAQTSPVGVTLNAISCITASYCMAVGDPQGAPSRYSTILSTTTGGTTWTSLTNAPTANTALDGIWCVSTTTCLATGASGHIFVTTNWGTTWSAPASNTTNLLYNIACSSVTACWAVGASGTIDATTDGGTTWTLQTSGTTNTLYGNICITATQCFAEGASGTLLETTNGIAWSPLTSGTTQTLLGAVCVSTTQCWVDGNAGTIIETSNGGSTWSADTVPNGTTNLVSMGVAPTGSGSYQLWVVGASGAVWTTSYPPVSLAVTSVAPATGPAAGGTPVTITGTAFSGVTAVKFGVTAATSYTVNSTTQITATSPAGSGSVDVTVTTGAGTSATSSADTFTYGTFTATSTALTSSLNPSSYGQSVTFTATVTGSAPTGTVTFYDRATSLGTGTLNGSGVAQLALTSLSPGVHLVTARYPGDAGNLSSTSSTTVQDVSAPTWTWGTNSYGDTGIGSVSSTGCSCVVTPANMAVNPAVLVANGWSDSMEMKPDGTIWVEGYGGYGEFGTGTQTSSATPGQVPGLTGLTITALDAGAYGGAVVTSTGHVYDWGNAGNGQIGDNTVVTTGCSCKTATEVKDPAGTGFLSNVVQVVGNLNMRAALTSSGQVYTWGDNTYGSIGDGTTTQRNLPVLVAGPLSGQTVVAISASFVTMYALTSSGNVYAWGYNNDGQAGNGTVSSTGCGCIPVPTEVVGVGGTGALSGITAISAGGYQVIALSSAGNVYAWGDGAHGDLGNGSNANSSTPVEVLGVGGSGFLGGVSGITMANATAYALKPDGSLWAWGDNSGGQLAINSSDAVDHATPVQADIAQVRFLDPNGAAPTSNAVLATGYPSTIGTVVATPSPGTVGIAESLTVPVSGAGPALTGTVTFYDGTTSLGSATVSSGSATLSTAAMGVGAHSLKAVYNGDTNYGPSTSGVTSLTLAQGTSTTTLTSSAASSPYASTVTFTATVNVGGPNATGSVTFKDGATTLGTGTLVANVATLATSTLAVGPHSITAVWAGDANYTGSTSSALSQTITQASSTTGLASSNNPSTPGQSVTFTATVTVPAGPVPNGEVITFKDGAATLGTALTTAGVATYSTSSLAAGSHSITASYPGDGNYAASTSSVLTQVVNATTSATALTSSGSPSTYDSAVTLTATVTFSGTIPTGENVTFCDGGTGGTSCTGGVILGTGTINSGTGVASLTTSVLSVASHTVLAYYPGDGTYPASSGTTTQVVNAGTLTVTAPPALSMPGLAPGTASASTALGSLTFTNTLGDQTGWSVTVGSTDLCKAGVVGMPFSKMSVSVDQSPSGGSGAVGSLAAGAASQTLGGADGTPCSTFSPATASIASGTANSGDTPGTAGTWTMANNKITVVTLGTAVSGTYTGTLQYTITG